MMSERKGILLSALLGVCVKTVEMSSVQACLWFSCQPKEPKNLRKMDFSKLK